jgi:5-(carboxyamino)imidazole ribonucleotide synthase
MEQLVTSDFKLGIISGGQLGKMLVLAASNWDVQTYIMDRDIQCPASSNCSVFVQGDNRSYEDVLAFGRKVDMITYEIEEINTEALRQLKSEGTLVCPDPEILATIQDKGLQKEFYENHGISSTEFTLFQGKQAILQALGQGDLQYPFVQKLRKGGYDGRGVAVIRNEKDRDKLLEGASVVEQLVDIRKEISVIVARNARGEVKCYPVVEMEFNKNANLVERLVCPASVGEDVREQAIGLAKKLANALNLQGILAVELFVDKDNRVLVNESAPRPHNSGHHTIESIITSQFEQLLRAIFDFPLGSTVQKIPAIMINLLGEPGFEGAVRYEGLTESLEIEGVKVHLYGKRITRPYRKMGHVTVLDPSLENARRKADLVKQQLKIKSWEKAL